MFTGIIEEVGHLVAVEHPDQTSDQAGTDARLVVRGPLVTSDAHEGDSIAVSGVCLTVTSLEDGTFAADVMPETLRLSMLGGLGAGDEVNLERALGVTGRFGGHIVQGHVDGVGTIVSRDPGERWDDVQIAVPAELARYIARKGSITVDGVSLTVTTVNPPSETAGPTVFGVSLIPTTLTCTTLGRLVPGTKVNLEVDVLAKYTERLLEAGR